MIRHTTDPTHKILYTRTLFGLSILFLSLSSLSDPHPDLSVNSTSSRSVSSINFSYQNIAVSNSQEINFTEVNKRWKKIDFTNNFTNPVVIPILDKENLASKKSFMIGIRNTNSNSFEIRMEDCMSMSEGGLPIEIPYIVIEQGRYQVDNGSSLEIKQRFLWDNCTTTFNHLRTSFNF